PAARRERLVPAAPAQELPIGDPGHEPEGHHRGADASDVDDASRRAGAARRHRLHHDPSRVAAPLEGACRTMAKAYSSYELARRSFLIAMAGVGTFIAVVFIFVL